MGPGGQRRLMAFWLPLGLLLLEAARAQLATISDQASQGLVLAQESEGTSPIVLHAVSFADNQYGQQQSRANNAGLSLLRRRRVLPAGASTEEVFKATLKAINSLNP